MAKIQELVDLAADMFVGNAPSLANSFFVSRIAPYFYRKNANQFTLRVSFMGKYTRVHGPVGKPSKQYDPKIMAGLNDDLTAPIPTLEWSETYQVTPTPPTDYAHALAMAGFPAGATVDTDTEAVLKGMMVMVNTGNTTKVLHGIAALPRADWGRMAVFMYSCGYPAWVSAMIVPILHDMANIGSGAIIPFLHDNRGSIMPIWDDYRKVIHKHFRWDERISDAPAIIQLGLRYLFASEVSRDLSELLSFGNLVGNTRIGLCSVNAVRASLLASWTSDPWVPVVREAYHNDVPAEELIRICGGSVLVATTAIATITSVNAMGTRGDAAYGKAVVDHFRTGFPDPIPLQPYVDRIESMMDSNQYTRTAVVDAVEVEFARDEMIAEAIGDRKAMAGIEAIRGGIIKFVRFLALFSGNREEKK